MRRVAALLAGLLILTPPLAAEGQEAGKVYRIGVLRSPHVRFRFPAITGRMSALGYVEGTNVAYESPLVASYEELPALAEELVGSHVDILVTVGTPATRAAKRATQGIPIVMSVESDPVKAGLVTSLGRPGGNITGVTTLNTELGGKRLELLKETVPALKRVGVLWNPANPDTAEEWEVLRSVAQPLGIELRPLEVRRREQIAPAFQRAVTERVGALLVIHDRSMIGSLIPALARENRLPVMYPYGRYYVTWLRGLMSYGPDPFDQWQHLAASVDKVLRGAKPAALPVIQPGKFELLINTHAAKALGLTIPPSVLVRADEILE